MARRRTTVRRKPRRSTRGSQRRVVSLALVLGTAFGLSQLPRGLARIELFRVDKIELSGARFLTIEDIEEVLDLPAETSVWDELRPWEILIAEHPLVAGVSVRRKLPGTLTVRVEERDPVAFVPSPTLRPVDALGRVLPIDPTRYRLDLPIIDLAEGGEAVRTKELSVIAAEIGRLTEVTPAFLGMVSEIRHGNHGNLVAQVGDPPVDFYFPVSASAQRIQEGLDVMDHVFRSRVDERPSRIDLRWADQVVVRLSRVSED